MSIHIPLLFLKSLRACFILLSISSSELPMDPNSQSHAFSLALFA